MKKHRLYFVILAVMVSTVFSGCNGLAELVHGPKPEPEGPPVTYTVIFNTNDATSGTAPAAMTAEAGSSITLPPGSGLSRANYTFGGWNTDAAGTGTDYSAGSSYTVTDNVTLYAKWNAVLIQQYTVTFNANGATSGSAPAVMTANAGSSITLPSGSGLSKTNFTFGGWNTDAAGTGTDYSAGSSYTVTGNITLYAKWIDAGATTYTVTFNINSGSGTAPAAQTVSSGSAITLPSGSGLSRTGYTFGGWNTDASGTGTNYNAGSSYTVAGTVTLYVKWDVAYTVTFDANGATSGTAPSVQTESSGSSIVLPSGSDLSRTNYTFGGWNTNTSGTGTNYGAGSSYTVTGNVTLYAKWDVTYTVTFNINSGSGTVPSAQTASSGSAITLPSGSGLSRTDYTFGGWNTDAAGTGTDYSAGSSYTVTGNITLYAKWIDAGATTYTVTFNINSGSGTAPFAQTVSSGSVIMLPSESGLSRTGYIFDGWNTDAAGTGTNYNAGSSYTVTSNVTLYAKWEDASTVWTVKFETNGGSAVGDAVVLINTAVSRPSPDPTKTGYTFDNWYTNTGLTAPHNFFSIITGNITLYAKWNPITYTVAYNANDGTGTTANSSHTYDVDNDLTSNGFTYTGYTFAGWAQTSTGAVEFTDGQSIKNLTATAGETVTLFAKWNPITYTVAYNANDGIGTTANSSHTYDVNNDLTSNGFTYTGYAFIGWARTSTGAVEFTNGQSVKNLTATDGETVTLYAKWELVTNVPGDTLAAKLSWLQTNALSNVDYTVEVSANESISPTTLSYSGKTNIKITLKGISAVRTVSLSSNGAMFTVASGVTLVLDNNITLQGLSSNPSLVTVNTGGTLVMNTGSRITGNSYYGVGGGVYVSGTFTMNGGTISGNSGSGGGGVNVGSGGTFTMSGGTISGNTASSTSSGSGGGVSVSSGGTFTMSGGTISGNTASRTSSGAPGYGGGVSVYAGTFTKTGGTIYGYSASDTTNSNVIKNNSGQVVDGGHAVCGRTSTITKLRNTTAGTSVNLSFNGSNGTSSGSWDN